MSKTIRRGFDPKDEKIFSGRELEKLRCAGADLHYLLNRGYGIKQASRFIGEHYQLCERQRLAMVRSISSDAGINSRKEREISGSLGGRTVSIDGFNLIITLEVALSGSVLLSCMDGTVRDLAELRGTYSLIDKTDEAIMCLGKVLAKRCAGKADFYLDAPVSNCGRLKTRILDLLSPFDFAAEVFIVDNADRELWGLECAATGDAIILDKCRSWVNLIPEAIADSIGNYPFVSLFPEVSGS